MADSTMITVSPDFDLQSFVHRFASYYQQQGYAVSVNGSDKMAFVNLSKGLGGINTILGLGEGLTVNFSLNGSLLAVNIQNPEWTSKIVGIILGCFLCFIPLITAIVGLVRQSNLQSNTIQTATMMAQTPTY